MTKFSAFQFVANLASDLNGELTDLENLLEQGTDKATEIASTYRHLGSFIQGVSYTIDFIEDDETRHEIADVIKEWQDNIASYRAKCMEIVYTVKVGREVGITTRYEACGTKTYTLYIANDDKLTCDNLDAVRDYIHENFK